MRADKESALHDYLKNAINTIGNKLSRQEPLDFLKTIERQEQQRAEFISSYRRIPLGIEPFFVILRKWNSYTPSLPLEASGEGRIGQYNIGGGYFLYVPDKDWPLQRGYGLVIDPGYNYILNFGMAGFCLDDMDGILITHAHNDHTNEFESLLTLLYERNAKFKLDRIPKTVDLFLNVGAFKKFSNYLDLSKEDDNNYIGNVIVMSPGQSYHIPSRDNTDRLDLEIVTLFADHHEIVTAKYAIGVCLKAAGRNIYITGDTGWNSETATKNERILQNHNIDVSGEDESQRINVLIAHIGSMKRKEFDLIQTADWKKAFYDNHLGVLGVLCVIEKFKPQLCIISEFGEELSDLRIEMSEALEVEGKKLIPDMRCLPGDVGLWLFPHRQQSICYLTEKK